MSPSATPRDAYLTIVPDDSFGDILDTIVDVTEESARGPVRPAVDDEEPFSISPAPQREVAPRRTSKLLVAGALGGGMVVGGGAVAALALVAMLAVGAVGAVGGAWWMLSGGEPVVVVVEGAPVAVPVDEDEDLTDDLAPVADEDGTDEDEALDGVDEVEEAAPAGGPAEAPQRAPAAPSPGPVAPPVTQPPPVAAPDAGEIPDDEVLVKLLSDPPAANVMVDGKSIGRTPLKAFLPAGNHTIVVESGKASGEFQLDPSSADRFCFKAKGRKVEQDACR